MHRNGALIENELCWDNRPVSRDLFRGKKERSSLIEQDRYHNVALILSKVPRKIPESITANHSENVGVVATQSKASKNGKTCGNATFTNTAK